MDRKLAAILAADVVGYSAQMERDEAGTFARLKAVRTELFEPEIARHHGRIFKLLGDGLLAEFDSAVDAVECAAVLQRGLAKRNADAAEPETIRVRIGINLGEVIVEGDDRYGEGVNIAARLEQMAEPGAVYISGKVAAEVGKKLAFGLEPMGERKVKNIAEPIAVFRVAADGRPQRHRYGRLLSGRTMAVGAALVLLGAAAAGVSVFLPTEQAQGKPAIAVLPFDNYGGDAASERLAAGLTEDIITDLARFHDFGVVARNSVEAYKGKAVDVRSVATALNVGYIVEGSIQKQDGRVRVTAQLIDAKTGNHLWSERWDRPDQDIFAVQTEISQKVTNQLAGGVGLIREAEKSVARRKRPDNLTAYELFLLGDEKLQQSNTESLKEAIVLLRKAVDIDPGLARGWSSLFHAYDVLVWSGVDPENNRKLATEAARRAAEADPNDAEARIALGASVGNVGDIARAKSEFDAALRLAPGSASVLTQYASWAATFGEQGRGGELADQAIRLDPSYPAWAAGRFAYAYFACDRYEDALRTLAGTSSEIYSPDIWIVHPAALAMLGRADEAKPLVQEGVRRYPDLNVEVWSNQVGYSAEEQDRFARTMRLAGFPICATPEQIAKLANPKRQPECVD